MLTPAIKFGFFKRLCFNYPGNDGISLLGQSFNTAQIASAGAVYLLFQQALQWLFGEDATSSPSYQAEFVNPEKREVTLRSPAGGVLFKESYFPNWKARFITEKGTQSLPIYQAGPGMMYVPLDGESTGTVVFEYKMAR